MSQHGNSLRYLRYLLFNPLLVAVLAGALVLGLAATTATAQTYSVLHSFGVLTNVTGCNPHGLVQGPDGALYGINSGEFNVSGVVFKMQPDGTGFTVLKYFTNSLAEGAGYPQLMLAGTTLYGTTDSGGSSNYGTVFKLNTDGTGFTVLKHFTGSDGARPSGSLVLAGTTLYGTTVRGGSFDNGTVFKLNADGSGFTVLKHFTMSDAGRNGLGLSVLSGTTLYGATASGGDYNCGTVFKLNTDGSGFTVLKHFTGSDGGFPNGGGLSLSGTTLYGATANSPGFDYGTIFKLNTDGSDFSVLKQFTPSEGSNPRGLVLAGATLYGETVGNGSPDYGTLFQINTDGGGYSVLKYFTSDERGPSGLVLSGSTFHGTCTGGGAFGAGSVFRVNTDGSGWVVLKTFSRGSEAAYPQAGLLLFGSTLYGTTERGGGSGAGTVFKVNTDGSGYVVLKQFTGNDGSDPLGTLVLSGTTLYGTTYYGGSSNSGTVFKLNTDGSSFNVLKHFTGDSDGRMPWAGLMLSGATLYGVAQSGGSFDSGTVFKLSTTGSDFAVLKHFTGSDGSWPRGRLLLSGATLYGTTVYGGTNDYGTVFKLNTNGSGFTVLKHFSGSSGEMPFAGLVLSGTTLYGVTRYGGFAEDAGTVFKLNTNGSGFTVLYRFTYGDGAYPEGYLVLSGTTLFGTTAWGGSFDNGTIFQINTDGSGFTLFKEFTGGSEGEHLRAGLLLSGTTLYGTTESGGDLDAGVVFGLSLGSPAPLAVLAPMLLPNGLFSFQMTGEPAQAVVIEASTNLVHWTPIATNVLGSAPLPFHDPDSTQFRGRFYRLAKP